MLVLLEMTNTNTDSDAKMVAYADDFPATGSILSLKYWWDTLCELGPKFGYFPKPKKSWLIVKFDCFDKAIHVFNDTNIQITTQVRRHLGAALGKSQIRNEYIMEKINKWVEELHILNEIEKIVLQAEYTCFLSGYKHKFNYYMRIIPGIGKLLRNVDESILTAFIRAITGGIFITKKDTELLSLAPRLGGLGIPIFEELCEIEYQNSVMISEHLCKRITDQFRRHEPGLELDTKKKQIKSLNKGRQILEIIRNEMSSEERKQNDLNLQIGRSFWLTTLPIKEQEYVLNKQIFWDLLSIRYGCRLKRIPSQCACGNTFNLQHALQCPKGGFMTLRHTHSQNTTANFLTEAYKDVRVEPQLQPLSSKKFSEKTSNKSDQARVGISARGFWLTGQVVFFDVRVFSTSAKRYVNLELRKSYEVNEKEKKKQYNDLILQIKHGTFTPLVMSLTGSMGRESIKFYTRISKMILEKRKENYAFIVTWIRRKI